MSTHSLCLKEYPQSVSVFQFYLTKIDYGYVIELSHSCYSNEYPESMF